MIVQILWLTTAAFTLATAIPDITHQLPPRPKAYKSYTPKPSYTPAPYHPPSPTPYHSLPSPAPYHPSPAPLPPAHPVKPVLHPDAHHDPYYAPDPYDEGPSNYAFGYSVNDEYTGEDFSHTESRDGYITSGEYRVALPDGRIQIVTYTADDAGYHADVKYEGVPHPHHPHEPIVPYKAALPPPPAPLKPVAPHPHPYKSLPPPKPEPTPPLLHHKEPLPLKPHSLPALPKILHHLPPPPQNGYPRSLPLIKNHAPLPKAFLPTPGPYTPTHYKPYLPTLSPYHAPLKSAALEPAVYKPKPDPYAAKLASRGGYIG